MGFNPSIAMQDMNLVEDQGAEAPVQGAVEVVPPNDQTQPVDSSVALLVQDAVVNETIIPVDVLGANGEVVSTTTASFVELVESSGATEVEPAKVSETDKPESDKPESDKPESDKHEGNADADAIDQKIRDVHLALQDPAVLQAVLASVGAANAQKALTKEQLEKAAGATTVTVGNAASEASDAVPTLSSQTSSAGKALADGAMSLMGGAGQLLGGAGALLGMGMKRGADTLSASLNKASERSLNQSGAAKLNPMLSEYRVNHAQKAADDYRTAMETMWTSGAMPDVRKAIEERASALGLSVPDVVEKMKPNGELKDLHEQYTKALAESPEAGAARKAMDKSLSSWARSYNAGMQEAADPDTPSALKEALEKSKSQMGESVKDAPAVGDAPSDFEKFKELVERIMERVKEFVESMKGLFSGSRADHGPS